VDWTVDLSPATTWPSKLRPSIPLLLMCATTSGNPFKKLPHTPAAASPWVPFCP